MRLRKSLRKLKNLAVSTHPKRSKSQCFAESGLELISGHIPDPEQVGLPVFATVRNEILRLPYFLEYYRKMGVILFIVADNQSEDGTTDFLMQEPDVLLFRASGRYSESKWGVDWLNALLHRFGQNRWCLSVDVDELLVFPHCEQHGLSKLTAYLDAKGANALPTFLIDMYSREPIRAAKYRSGLPFLSVCPFFDPAGYIEHPVMRVPARGGPRHRLFWQGRVHGSPSPYLPKIPLVRWSKNMLYESSTHRISRVHLSDVTGALLHFKFFADFPTRVKEEVARQEHFNGASQYAAYWELINEQPDLSAFHEESVRYEDSLQLVSLGLLHSPESFERYMERPR